jgi:hypothetical protein
MHRPGLSSHFLSTHDTLRIDRPDLMRLPSLFPPGVRRQTGVSVDRKSAEEQPFGRQPSLPGNVGLKELLNEAPRHNAYGLKP